MNLFRKKEKTPDPETYKNGRVYDYTTEEGRVATAEWLFEQAKNERTAVEDGWVRNEGYYNFVHAAAAESCTGGMIAERLTNVPGSSEVFGYGFVTYAEAAKQKLLGVDAAVIEKYNVVSGPVAAAMAFGAARESGAELAVGITGLAGPGGALPGKPVGTVYLAGADTRTDTGYLMRLTLGGYQDRQIIRTRAALYALDMLRRMALGLDVPDSVRFTPETADRDLDI